MTGAVKILSSSEVLAPENEITLIELRSKHPPHLKENILTEPPDENFTPLIVTEKEVYLKIRGFHNGSAAGINGILPQHKKI